MKVGDRVEVTWADADSERGVVVRRVGSSERNAPVWVKLDSGRRVVTNFKNVRVLTPAELLVEVDDVEPR